MITIEFGEPCITQFCKRIDLERGLTTLGACPVVTWRPVKTYLKLAWNMSRFRAQFSVWIKDEEKSQRVEALTDQETHRHDHPALQNSSRVGRIRIAPSLQARVQTWSEIIQFNSLFHFTQSDTICCCFQFLQLI